MLSADIQNLIQWYQLNRRDLPWRQSRNPYTVWISEIMLQQTTSTAVIPFYNRFVERFPTVKSLASAKIDDIYSIWAGLGYYSRARNIHKAALIISEMNCFPQTYEELLKLPGIGPYTSRAISSIAFSESVGVLDGNVIRVLCRFNNLKLQWWKTAERDQLQKLSDQCARLGPANIINQALMELGSQICTPQKPHCMLCPLVKTCKGNRAKTAHQLPLPKPKKKNEIWVWTAQIVSDRSNKIALTPNEYLPFLKGLWVLPGKAKKVLVKPKKFAFRHSITHHEIYVQIQGRKKKSLTASHKNWKWVERIDVSKYVPASLIRKALDHNKETES